MLADAPEEGHGADGRKVRSIAGTDSAHAAQHTADLMSRFRDPDADVMGPDGRKARGVSGTGGAQGAQDPAELMSHMREPMADALGPIQAPPFACSVCGTMVLIPPPLPPRH